MVTVEGGAVRKTVLVLVLAAQVSAVSRCSSLGDVRMDRFNELA